MNKLHKVFITLLMLGTACRVLAQGTGVHSRYIKDNQTTHVETSILYVYNTPEQFVQLQLHSWYKGATLTSPPGNVDVEVFSFSKDPLYRKDKDRSFTIVADGAETSLGHFSDTVMKGTNNRGDTFFIVGENPDIEMQVAVPESAQIKSAGNLNGMTMEWLGLSMQPEQFLKLAKAAKLEFRIGNTALPLTDRQTEIVHNFVNQLTLENR